MSVCVCVCVCVCETPMSRDVSHDVIVMTDLMRYGCYDDNT